jgi:hypothetical protein
MQDPKRAYAAGAFAIEIDGAVAGLLSSVTGGSAFGVVVDDPKGAGPGVSPKRLANVGFRDITITCGIPHGALADWITAFLAGASDFRDGAIVFLDYTYKDIKRLEWMGGTITSVTFPRLDAASTLAASLSVDIAVGRTAMTAGTGSALGNDPGGKAAKWSVSNFALAIPGVDCTTVATVDELTVSAVPTNLKSPHLGPPQLGDLVVSATQSRAQGFDSWAQDSFFLGNQGEKTATITYLSPDLKTPLMSVQLDGVGIFEVAESTMVRGSESIPRTTASAYCEQVTCLPAAAPAPAPVEPAPSTAALEGILRDLATTLQLSSTAPNPAADAAAVARRLQAVSPTTSALDADSSRAAAGKDIGAAWARGTATLDELESVASTAGTAWTALSLADGHSLIGALQIAGVVPVEHDAALELTRDPFVVGLVEGASEVLGQVQPHLIAVDRVVEAPPGP